MCKGLIGYLTAGRQQLADEAAAHLLVGVLTVRSSRRKARTARADDSNWCGVSIGIYKLSYKYLIRIPWPVT